MLEGAVVNVEFDISKEPESELRKYAEGYLRFLNDEGELPSGHPDRVEPGDVGTCYPEIRYMKLGITDDDRIMKIPVIVGERDEWLLDRQRPVEILTQDEYERMVRKSAMSKSNSKVDESVLNVLLAGLPAHNAGMSLEHNQHKNAYEKAEDWINKNEWCDWESEDAKRQAIATDEIWTLQWYPKTPVGFCAVAAPTLADLLRIANDDS